MCTQRQVILIPHLSPSHLFKITIHVLRSDGRIRNKLEELPNSHDSHSMLEKEICQERRTLMTVLQREYLLLLLGNRKRYKNGASPASSTVSAMDQI